MLLFTENNLYEMINLAHSQMNALPVLQTAEVRAFNRFHLQRLVHNYSVPEVKHDKMKTDALKERILECFPPG